MGDLPKSQIVIADFGSQYTYLIAKTIRKLGCFCEIVDPQSIAYDDIKSRGIRLVILSGGPQSVYGDGVYYNSTVGEIGRLILDPDVCVFGICYGMQYICQYMKGTVEKGSSGEYGKADLMINPKYKSDPMISWIYDDVNRTYTKTIKQSTSEKIRNKLFKPLVRQHPKEAATLDQIQNKVTRQVWMSHQDVVTRLPNGFINLGGTDTCKNAIVCCPELRVYATQFHPEVKHTLKGKNFFKAILFGICKCERNWKPKDILDECKRYIISKATNDSSLNVILGFSGGADSMVTACLIKEAIGSDRLKCVMLDHGMLRQNETQYVTEVCSKLNIAVKIMDVSDVFLGHLSGVTDPETKRKIIGEDFVRSFESIVGELKNKDNWLLAQGTIYPDVVESAKGGTNKDLIKSHHNVGGLPEKMGLKLLEPLQYMFKNEVRNVGRLLGIPSYILNRHPFPGPGLGIRVIGEVTRDKLDTLRRADKIFNDKMVEYDLYGKISQAYVALLNTKSVGVVGDQRRYGYIACIRAVQTKDFMTATPYHFDFRFLEMVSTEIINECPAISRVVYDITSKPPATIEME